MVSAASDEVVEIISKPNIESAVSFGIFIFFLPSFYFFGSVSDDRCYRSGGSR
jgi:hypothetical protein